MVSIPVWILACYVCLSICNSILLFYAHAVDIFQCNWLTTGTILVTIFLIVWRKRRCYKCSTSCFSSSPDACKNAVNGLYSRRRPFTTCCKFCFNKCTVRLKLFKNIDIFQPTVPNLYLYIQLFKKDNYTVVLAIHGPSS